MTDEMKKILLFLMLVIVANACTDDNTEQDKPVISKDYIQVTSSLQLQADGEEQKLAILANCSWNISASESWLTVTPMTGNGTQNVTVVAGKNTTGSTRTAVLTIRGGTAPMRQVTVTQPKSTDGGEETTTLTATPSELIFEAGGEVKELTIKSNTSWAISCPEWCSLSYSSGIGDATITVTAQANPGKEQRTGNLVIVGNETPSVTISLTQKAKTEETGKEPGADDNQPPT